MNKLKKPYGVVTFDYSKHSPFYNHFGVNQSKFFTPSPISICRTELLNESTQLTKFSSDIFLLFNEERLRNTLGLEQVKQWIDTFNKTADTPIPKIDDNVLLSYVKSRHCQSPSELNDWSDYLNANSDTIIKRVNNIFGYVQSSIKFVDNNE